MRKFILNKEPLKIILHILTVTMVCMILFSCKKEFNMHHIDEKVMFITPIIENPDSIRLEVIENGDCSCFDKLYFAKHQDIDSNLYSKYIEYCFLMANIYNCIDAYYLVFAENYYVELGVEKDYESEKTYYENQKKGFEYLKKWISLKRAELKSSYESSTSVFIENRSHNNEKIGIPDTILIKIIEKGDYDLYKNYIKPLSDAEYSNNYSYDVYSYVMADIYGFEYEYFTAAEFLDIFTNDTSKEDKLRGLYYYNLWSDYMLRNIVESLNK